MDCTWNSIENTNSYDQVLEDDQRRILDIKDTIIDERQGCMRVLQVY